MEHQSTPTPLSSWSWQNIQSAYWAFGQVLISYENIAKRIKVPTPDINYSDPENTFLIRWHTDIMRIDKQLKALDEEIARRNQLIGVMG